MRAGADRSAQFIPSRTYLLKKVLAVQYIEINNNFHGNTESGESRHSSRKPCLAADLGKHHVGSPQRICRTLKEFVEAA